MRIWRKATLTVPGLALLLACVAGAAAAGAADTDGRTRTLRTEDLKALAWRSIGPANMGGRVATIAIAPDNPKTIFVGYATGGVWKSTNLGTTFAPVFDKYDTSSIGSIAVCDAPKSWPGWKDEAKKDADAKAESKSKVDDKDKGKAKIVWVGTGEGNGRNSSSWGHGVYRSTDGGGTYEHKGLEDTHDIPAIAADPRNPDVCYVAALGHLWGANKERGVYKTSDGGKTWKAVLQIDEKTGACDVVVDPKHPDTIYAAMYDRRRTLYSYRSGGPEGGIYRSRNAGKTWKKLTKGLPGRRAHRDTGQWRIMRPAAKEGEPRYRFNWNAPFFISPHDSTTLYHAGNCVFKLTERGDKWERISGDLSTRDVEKILTAGSEAETHGTVVALAESPLTAGLLWAGTDDGLIHVTTNDGKDWKDVTPKAARGLYVSKIEPSPHDKDVAYAAIVGYRSDHFEPILLETRDRGRTWTSIAGNLPSGAPVKVVRADPRNPRVLYAGTERAAWVTIDGGQRWVKLNGKSLPTVAVDDLAIQAREMDLVAGTHGRSIYILDGIASLSALTTDIVRSEFHVFEPMPGQPRFRVEYGELWSDRLFAASNPPMGASIDYWIREYTVDDVEVIISAGGDDEDGHMVRKLKGTSDPGLNRVVWDLQPEKAQRLGNPHDLPEFVPAGSYTVTVKYGERTEKTTLEVRPAPGR